MADRAQASTLSRVCLMGEPQARHLRKEDECSKSGVVFLGALLMRVVLQSPHTVKICINNRSPGVPESWKLTCV